MTGSAAESSEPARVQRWLHMPSRERPGCLPPLRSDGILQLLESGDLRGLRCGTGLEGGRLASERVGALARLACLDVLTAYLDEPGTDGDRATRTNTVRDDFLQRIEHCRRRALLDACHISDGALQLSLRHVCCLLVVRATGRLLLFVLAVVFIISIKGFRRRATAKYAYT